MGNRSDRFIQQARADYAGEPTHIAFTTDACGEQHVVIKMSSGYYLDWIGAEFAAEPDEWDKQPEGLRLIWKPINKETVK